MRPAWWMQYGAGLAMVALCMACGGSGGDAAASRAPGASNGRAAPSGAAGPVESTTAASGRATGRATPSRDGAPRALFIGTSLTAGLGLADPESESWPAVIQHIADSTGVPLRVVNAGLSGETSAGALRRSEWLLREPYDAIVIETGANDGLRGLNADSTAANIRAIIQRARAANPGSAILVVQMEAPTNMGPRYTRGFHDLYPRVARESGAVLLPFLLEGVGGHAALNQPDGIHPTAEGARLAARNVWPGIRMALKTR